MCERHNEAVSLVVFFIFFLLLQSLCQAVAVYCMSLGKTA